MGEVPLQVKKAAVNKSGSSWLDDDDSEEEEDEPEPVSHPTAVQRTRHIADCPGHVMALA